MRRLFLTLGVAVALTLAMAGGSALASGPIPNEGNCVGVTVADLNPPGWGPAISSTASVLGGQAVAGNVHSEQVPCIVARLS